VELEAALAQRSNRVAELELAAVALKDDLETLRRAVERERDAKRAADSGAAETSRSMQALQSKCLSLEREKGALEFEVQSTAAALSRTEVGTCTRGRRYSRAHSCWCTPVVTCCGARLRVAVRRALQASLASAMQSQASLEEQLLILQRRPSQHVIDSQWAQAEALLATERERAAHWQSQVAYHESHARELVTQMQEVDAALRREMEASGIAHRAKDELEVRMRRAMCCALCAVRCALCAVCCALCAVRCALCACTASHRVAVTPSLCCTVAPAGEVARSES
jgi:DNA repair exonuclease SbcCD ATPase subunit